MKGWNLCVLSSISPSLPLIQSLLIFIFWVSPDCVCSSPFPPPPPWFRPRPLSLAWTNLIASDVYSWHLSICSRIYRESLKMQIGSGEPATPSHLTYLQWQSSLLLDKDKNPPLEDPQHSAGASYLSSLPRVSALPPRALVHAVYLNLFLPATGLWHLLFLFPKFLSLTNS